jgi:hypothetical protein
MFRRLLVDVLVSSCYGYRLGAVTSMNLREPLSTSDELCAAIKSFPIRGVIVSPLSSFNELELSGSHAFACTQRSAVPTWLWNLLCRIPNKQWRQICDSDRVMAEVGKPASFLSGLNMIWFDFYPVRWCSCLRDASSNELRQEL